MLVNEIDCDFSVDALCYNFSQGGQFITPLKALYRLSLGGYKRLDSGLILVCNYLLLKGI